MTGQAPGSPLMKMSGLGRGQAAWLEARGVAGPFRRLAEGFRADILESRSGLVVRIGKSPADDNAFQAETRVMDVVGSSVNIEIPRPTLVEDSVPEFPHGVMVYPKLAGTSPTVPTSALARSAALVLRQIHAIATDAVVPVRVVDLHHVATLIRATGPFLTEARLRTTERWQSDLRHFLARRPARCLVHGDFWHANWLTTEDERIVIGLLDFERSGIGFRHEDFAPMKYFGEDFRTAALAAYCEGSAQDPASLLEEIRVFDVLRELRGLGWALRNPQAGELQDAIEKVAAGLANYG